jgi:CoA-transferase family III
MESLTVVPYWHIWTDADGISHQSPCELAEFQNACIQPATAREIRLARIRTPAKSTIRRAGEGARGASGGRIRARPFTRCPQRSPGGPGAARGRAAARQGSPTAAGHTAYQRSPLDVDTSFGKKNTYMDLRSEVDRSRILELVRECDVFVQGFRWGSFASRGFGPDELSRVNPRLIYVEANAYGFQGPWAERRGWEQLAQAGTGLADLHSAGREKLALVPVYFNDYGSGCLGALGVLPALLRRADEGGSWSVRVALAKTAMLGRVSPKTMNQRCRSMMPNWTATSSTRHRRSDSGSSSLVLSLSGRRSPPADPAPRASFSVMETFPVPCWRSIRRSRRQASRQPARLEPRGTRSGSGQHGRVSDISICEPMRWNSPMGVSRSIRSGSP